jgi:hypothetical protein
MPRPNFEKVEYFDPLPSENSEPEWRDVRHGLNSMDLLVDQKLGGENESGEVEWITNEQLFLQLTDRNTVSVRWNIDDGTMERIGLSDPRVRLTIWRW